MAKNNPAELPEGGEGGGSRTIRVRPGGVGGPNELPAFEKIRSYRSLVNEIFSLRNRVHALESNAVATRLSGFSRVGLPNEMPEGGEISEIWGPPRPEIGEISEIAELPIDRQLFGQIAVLNERLSSLESKLLQSIQVLQTRIEGMKR